MKKYIYPLLLALPLLFGCEKESGVPTDELIERKDFVLTRSELDFIQENNGFALDLFKRVSAMANGGSTVISPLSVTMDFGMVNNGAAGETQKEINKVLGYKDDSIEGLNSFCKSILKQSSEVDPTTTVEIGNAAIVNKSMVSMKDSFTKTIKSSYGAEVIYKAFGKDDVKGLVNNWSNKKTKGMIPSIMEQQPGSNDYAFFLNAVYFKGKWTKKFDAAKSRDEEFTLEDGSSKTVRMMQKKYNFSYGEISGLCKALCLPYGNEAYRMVVLLPEEGKRLDDVKDALDCSSWDTMIKGMNKVEVDVKLPTFETATDLISLKGALVDMGISKAFTPGDADFSNMTKDNVHISDVLHKATIKVDEMGAEAAAVTSLAMTMSAYTPPQYIEFHADHPFMYAITEVSSGAIFFIGQYTGK